MSYPADVVLPLDAKFYGFVDNKVPYNAYWDITWSLSYALTGTQHALCTFLTTSSSLISAIPGQYLGYLSESSVNNGVLAVALDSTGFFALSNTNNGGVSLNNVRPNTLIVRYGNDLVYNEQLSSLDSNFQLAQSAKSYQSLRFRMCNGNKLYVDYRPEFGEYNNLATIPITAFDIDTHPILYPAFTYSSPISSSSISPSKFWLKNFHSQGFDESPTYETVEFVPLSS